MLPGHCRAESSCWAWAAQESDADDVKGEPTLTTHTATTKSLSPVTGLAPVPSWRCALLP